MSIELSNGDTSFANGMSDLKKVDIRAFDSVFTSTYPYKGWMIFRYTNGVVVR